MVCHNCKDFFKFRKIVSLFPLFVSPFWAKKFIYTHYKAIRHIENSKVAEITPLLSIITSNVNGLNFPIKIDWKIDLKKHYPTIWYLWDTLYPQQHT